MAYDNRFDARALLKYDKAIFVTDQERTYEDKGVIVLQWENIPTGALSELKAWAIENRKSLSSQDVDFRNISATYRSVGVETSVRNKSGVLSHTFAKGLYTALDWESAFLAQREMHPEKDSFETNDLQADAGEDYLYIRFPYIDPAFIKAVAEELPSEIAENLVVEGQEYTGAYHLLMANPRKDEETGDFTLEVIYAKPQFEIDAYESWSTIGEVDVKELWQVPKRLVETILSNWKEEGKSARVRKGSQPGSVDITLMNTHSSEGKTDSYLSRSNCAFEATSYHYWGVKQSLIDTGIYQIDYEVTPEGEPAYYLYHYNQSGYSVNKDVRSSRDGKFDIVITVIMSKDQSIKYEFASSKDSLDKREEHKAMTPADFVSWLKGELDPAVMDNFEIDYREHEEGKDRDVRVSLRDDCLLDLNSRSTETTGGDQLDPVWQESMMTQRRQELYWGKGKQAILDAFSSTGEDESAHWAKLWEKEEGLTKQVELSRRGDGTFDMSITVITVSELEVETIDSNLPSEGADTRVGIKHKVVSKLAADDPPDLKTEKRTRYRTNLTPRPDGKIDWTVETSEAMETKTEKNIETTEGVPEGIQVRSKMIANADDADTINFTPGKRKRHNINVTPNDDGTLSGSATEQEVQEVDSGLIGGTGAGQVQARGFANKDTVTVDGGGVRKRATANIRANDDGTLSGGEQINHLAMASGTATGSGTGIKDSATGYANQDAVPPPTASAKRKRVQPRVQVNDDGTFSGSEQVTEVQQTDGSIEVGELTVSAGSNKDSVPAPITNVVARGVQVSFADDGTANYSIQHTPLYTESITVSDGTSSAKVGLNVDIPEVGDPPWKPGADDLLTSFRAIFGDNGKINYSATLRDIEAGELTIGGSSGVGAVPGKHRKFYFGHNKDTFPALTGELLSASAQRGDKDLWRLSLVEEDTNGFDLNIGTEVAYPYLDQYGYEDQVLPFFHKSAAEMPKLTGDETGRYSSMRIENDGTLTGILHKRTYKGHPQTTGVQTATGLKSREIFHDRATGDVSYRDTTYTIHLGFYETLAGAMSAIQGSSPAGVGYIDVTSVSVTPTTVRDEISAGVYDVMQGWRAHWRTVTAEDNDFTLIPA